MVNGESTNRTEGDNWGVASYSITEDTAPIANKIYFVVENGVYKGKVNLTEFEAGTDYYEQTGGTFYEFCFIGQNTTTKDFYIFTCNGKGTETEIGMSHEQGIAILQNCGCDFAWQPDGGGSTSLIYRGEMLNNKTDGQTSFSPDGKGYNERKLGNYLYFYKDVKTDKDADLSKLNKKIGELKELLNDLNLDIVNKDTVNNFAMNINNTTSNTQMVIRFQRNGVNRVSLVADNNSAGAFGVWNNVLSKTIFSAEPDGRLKNANGYLANLLDRPISVTDIDNIVDTDGKGTTGFFTCAKTVTNAPFDTTDSFIFQWAWNDKEVSQIALVRGRWVNKIKTRAKTWIDGTLTWTSWYTYSAGTST